MRQLPEHGKCFVCGSDNPKSIGARWFTDDEGNIFTEIELTEHQQGPPGLAHGGAIAALLDEVMGAAVWQSGFKVAAKRLNIDYIQPVPLGAKIKVLGFVTEKDGKKVFTYGEILLPDKEKAASATGLYVEAKHLFAAANDEFLGPDQVNNI